MSFHLTYAMYTQRRCHQPQLYKRSMAAKTDPMDPAIAPTALNDEDAAPVKTAGVLLLVALAEPGTTAVMIAGVDPAAPPLAAGVDPAAPPLAAGEPAAPPLAAGELAAPPLAAGELAAPPLAAGVAPASPPAGVVMTTVGDPGQAVQVTAVVVKPAGGPLAIGVVPVAVAVTV